MNTDIDIRDLLATISVPTLVLHRAHETWREGSRYMGEHIPGARMVELPGDDHLPWEGDAESVLDEIERFLSDAGEELEPDCVLATLLVADIVEAPAKATEVGDRNWNDLVIRYQRLVRAQLARFRGRESDTAGNTLLATFDGPARAIRCALAIVTSVRDLGLETRVGVHTGEVEQTTTASAEPRSTLQHGSPRPPPGRGAHLEHRQETSLPAPASSSRNAANTNWTRRLAPGVCSLLAPDSNDPPGGRPAQGRVQRRW